MTHREDDIPTLTETIPPEPSVADVLRAVLQLSSQVNALFNMNQHAVRVADTCFRELTRVPVLEDRVDALAAKLATLEFEAGRGGPCAPPAPPPPPRLDS